MLLSCDIFTSPKAEYKNRPRCFLWTHTPCVNHIANSFFTETDSRWCLPSNHNRDWLYEIRWISLLDLASDLPTFSNQLRAITSSHFYSFCSFYVLSTVVVTSDKADITLPESQLERFHAVSYAIHRPEWEYPNTGLLITAIVWFQR